MKKLLAILYTTLFTIITLVIILIFSLKSYLNGNFYTNLIANDSFMQTKLSDLNLNIDALEKATKLCSEDCTIEEAIVEISKEEFGINEKLTKEALKDTDIQKAVGEFVSTFVNSETTGVQEKINYKTYEKALDKDIAKKILDEKNLTKEDVKQIIDKYNNSIDTYQNGGNKYAINKSAH